ncbi:MAG: hypothetical protein FWD02_05820 [Bacteroidales bacterium]|nr:hypothetical protein [Bacteroidales bacterium]
MNGKANNKQMSRFARHDDGLGKGEEMERILGEAQNPFHLPSSPQNAVIPSVAHVVCEVEESPCYGRSNS